MKILVVNDDGYQAEGLKILLDIIKDLGDIYVIAPKEHKSGMSSAITIRKYLEVQEIAMANTKKAYYVDGMPADCTRISGELFKDIKFDFLISGINEGANVGSNIMHSGTIGAAVEALHFDLPAIAVSAPYLKYENAKKYTKGIIEVILESKLLSPHYLLNINFPDSDTKPKGLYFSSQSINYELNKFEKKGNLFLPIYKRKEDLDELSDVYGYFNNYITITPILRSQDDLRLTKELNNRKIDFNI